MRDEGFCAQFGASTSVLLATVRRGDAALGLPISSTTVIIRRDPAWSPAWVLVLTQAKANSRSEICVCGLWFVVITDCGLIGSIAGSGIEVCLLRYWYVFGFQETGFEIIKTQNRNENNTKRFPNTMRKAVEAACRSRHWERSCYGADVWSSWIRLCYGPVEKIPKSGQKKVPEHERHQSMGETKKQRKNSVSQKIPRR